MTAKQTAWFTTKRIVVTGGAGFLGRVVVEKLYKYGCREVFVPRRAQFDLTRWENIERLFDEARPQVLLHLAAAVANPPDRSNAASSFYENVMMTTQLMEAARLRGVEKMLCLGSASSYPSGGLSPLAEGTLFQGLPEAVRAAHGVAKRLPLIQAQAYREQYAFSCIFLIPTNLYGPGDNFDAVKSYVIPSLIRRLIEAEEEKLTRIILSGTGAAAVRDFLYVEDCAEAILLALDRYDGAAAVNLASGIGCSIRHLAQVIAQLTGYAGSLSWDAAPSDQSPRRVLDPNCAEREFGFRARWNLNDGLRQTIEWYRREIVPLRGAVGGGTGSSTNETTQQTMTSHA